MASDRVLTLESPEPAATRIFDEAGNILYTVSTKSFNRESIHGEDRKHLTDVHGATNEVLATLEWYDSLEYYVTYGTDERKPLDDWAKTSWIPLVHTVTVKADDGHPYKWKLHPHQTNMDLFDEEESSKELYPIARVIESSSALTTDASDKDSGTQEQSTVRIHLTPQAWEIRDMIVLSFLFLDKKRRNYDYFFHWTTVLGSGGYDNTYPHN